MTALIYFFVGIYSATLGARAWFADRGEPRRQAFLGMGAFIALAYLSFALSLLPGLGGLRLVYMGAGACVPAFTLWCIDRLLVPRDATASPHLGRIFAATAIVVPVSAIIQAVFYLNAAWISPPQAIAGLFTTAAFGFALYRLWEVHEETDVRLDQSRLQYLLVITGGAVLFTIAEQVGRSVVTPPDLTGISLANRGVLLQGPLPPVSALFTAGAMTFLYHTILMSRLIDLRELGSRLLTLIASAAVLVLVDAIMFVWFGTFTDHPVHGTFQIFLGSVLFLAAYDPVREQVSWWSNRLFNQRGQQLAEVLLGLRMRLPTVISTHNLTDTLLSRLHGSGRVPTCSIYLWDQKLQSFACVGHRGFDEERPLAAIAAHPFTDPFLAEEAWYLRGPLARKALTDVPSRELLAILDACHADLVVPLLSRGLVLGWMMLRDEDWSDGFSSDEIEKLADIADLVSVVLSNIHDFQALEEEHRLTALGAMAAGLAHEIRNPLAGIKGAAQYLQSESLQPDAREMIDVVIDETDRLNEVVSQFLDYARPLTLSATPDHVNALVAHVLVLVRAQGLPKDVTVVEGLSPNLPSIPVDRARLTQVVLNLCQNALQAMPHGGTLTVTTSRRMNRSLRPVLEIAVTDTGEGIEAADMEKLFIPFFTTKASGTGLGLGICQRIVQAHGGEIDVLSAPGRGSTFSIRLPWPQEEPSE